MNPHLTHFHRALERLEESNHPLELGEWAKWPEPRETVSPWAAWLLVGLVRHQARQEWLADTIRFRLDADLNAIAEAGAFGHPDRPQHALVPGLTDWEYYFHGRGCQFTHRITGESLDVDFYDDTGDWFDDFFYINYLKSLKSPAFAEKRLIQLHPTLRTIWLAFQELLEAELLIKHPDSKVVRLTSECLTLAEGIEWLEQKWNDPNHRHSFAAGIGDWLLLEEELSPDDPLRPPVSARAVRCRDIRFAQLKQLYEQPEPRSEILKAMADLEPPELPAILEQTLAGPPSGMTSAALEIVADWSDARWIEAIYRLFCRVNPNGNIPEPHIWKTCAKYLLRHKAHTGEVRRSLKRAHRHELAEAALLALESAPETALTLFRRALRSRIPYNRITAAAALAILDEPWSRRELVAVLRESDDQEATAECRAALLLTHHAEAHKIVEDWETRNPHQPEAGPFISMQEMSLQSCPGFIEYEMQKLHERVLPLRGHPPPEPPRRWWWPFG